MDCYIEGVYAGPVPIQEAKIARDRAISEKSCNGESQRQIQGFPGVRTPFWVFVHFQYKLP